MAGTWTRVMQTMAALALGACVVLGQARAETVKCPDVKDVWVSSVGEEVDDSMGRTETMKLKVLQELAVMAFDVSQLKGRHIKSAELFIQPASTEGKLLIERRQTNLKWIVVSTVSSHWVEGEQSEAYKTDPKGHGATYNEASYQRKAWAWKGSDLSFVINGQLNSIYGVHELVKAEGGYWKVAVDPVVVQALVAGLGDGVSLMDGSGAVTHNSFLYSRKAKGKEPYLLVGVEGRQERTMPAPRVVTVEPDVAHATLEAGALAIRVKTPKEALGFHVKIDGQLLEPWQVALPGHPGAMDTIVLEDMPADKQLSVAVAAVDAAGNVSEWTEGTGRSSARVIVPDLPKFPFEPKAGEPAQAGSGIRVWAFPEVVMVDPVSALPLYERNKESYRNANPVWSGADGRIRLAAARGEIVAFQLALENAGESASAHLMVDLKSPDGKALPKRNINLNRVWYVQVKPKEVPQTAPRWVPEYAIPMLDATVQVPAPDNQVPRQALQAVYIDLVMPIDAQPGKWTGQLMVHARDGVATLPLEVLVYPVQIPVVLNFNPELNCYSGPAEAGTKEFFAYHRLAHYNRCTLNRVAYHQTGEVHKDMVPVVKGQGGDTHVADWSQYDKRIGPLLDGSAFAGLPRDGVPVRTFYLPLFDNWPLPLKGHYAMGLPPAKEVKSEGEAFQPNQDLSWKEIHDIHARPIAQSFDEGYKKGFVNVTADFVKHYDQKGWTRTICEMYLNNKYNYRGQWWTLDEPTEWLDWAALGFWARLFHQGTDTPHQARFLFRGDISRPQWQGGFMDGLMDIMYSGGTGLQWPRLMAHIRQRAGMDIYMYGSCNEIGRNNLESAAWCLKSYAASGDGVLPWQSLPEKKNPLVEPDNNGLLISGEKFGQTALVSLRVMAMRHGAQQCELLRQVQDRYRDWNRFHAAALVGQKVPLVSEFRQRFAEEAAAATFGELTGVSFVELKEGLLEMLSQPPTLPAARTRPGATQPSPATQVGR